MREPSIDRVIVKGKGSKWQHKYKPRRRLTHDKGRNIYVWT